MPVVAQRPPIPGTAKTGRLTDREAILVRADLPSNQLSVVNAQSGNFTYVITVPIPNGQLKVLRGWCAVDVSVRGQTLRYIDTHLEEETVPQLQVAQVQELLAGPAYVDLPVIITGDFNTDPLHRDGTYAYDLFGVAGFVDAWTVLYPSAAKGGLTWGHDEYLADPGTAFDRRIDLVFFRGAAFEPKQGQVIDLSLKRAQPPLWASDHAAVNTHFLISGASGD